TVMKQTNWRIHWPNALETDFLALENPFPPLKVARLAHQLINSSAGYGFSCTLKPVSSSGNGCSRVRKFTSSAGNGFSCGEKSASTRKSQRCVSVRKKGRIRPAQRPQPARFAGFPFRY